MSFVDTESDLLQDFRRLIDEAKNIVVFTGAGISTESGIPDFRSPTGLWTKMKPIQFQDFIASEEVRQESWRRRFENDSTFRDAKPNIGHMAVARLVETGKASLVITQNVDNLHQDSGIPGNRILELHGNATYAKCLSCALRYELEQLEQQFQTQGRVQPCTSCGGIIKSATISFGQSMPVAEMEQAIQAAEACDLFIVLGSSLVVQPAATLPEMAKQMNASLVIVNRENTPLDAIADLVIQESIGQVIAFVTHYN